MKEIALYTLDIAQNSITAQAKRLDITLTEEGETITLSIRDDGPSDGAWATPAASGGGADRRFPVD